VQVIATAGHVDHGKSTLVKALTGSEPDRLAEERRRGLSIALGYCWTSLPGAGEVAFVDVPGHERFIATTLSGMGPVPAVLFVVAADDPWMPQAAEHLAALDAFGVGHGILVVTRSDLTAPGPALERARAALAGTTLADIPAVTVSGRTGEGLDRLRTMLADLVRALPAPAAGSDVRLWVDRRFAVQGAGVVVTGTLPAGTIATGDTLLLDDTTVRVRAVESLGRSRPQVTGPARVALNLGGRLRGDPGPGSVLVAPGRWEPANVVDVRLRGEGRPPAQALLHIGAAAIAVHLRPLGDQHARLVLDRPLPLRVGDRALLRDPGSRRLWGALVLDPAPAPLRRRGAAAALGRTLAGYDGTPAHELARRRVVRVQVLERLGVTVPEDAPGVVRIEDWLLSAEAAEEARARITALAEADDGLAGGVPVAVAAQTAGLPDPQLVAALVRPPVRVEAGRVTAVDRPTLPPQVRAALDALRARLGDQPFAAPEAQQLTELGLDRRTLAALARTGDLLRLDEQIVLLPGADTEAVRRLRSLPQPFTTSQARTALDTTRRVVLPLLNHLDRVGATLRLPDDRRTVREGDRPAGAAE
jgi:selenocysteine-specific elongation factor